MRRQRCCFKKGRERERERLPKQELSLLGSLALIPSIDNHDSKRRKHLWLYIEKSFGGWGGEEGGRYVLDGSDGFLIDFHTRHWCNPYFKQTKSFRRLWLYTVLQFIDELRNKDHSQRHDYYIS